MVGVLRWRWVLGGVCLQVGLLLWLRALIYFSAVDFYAVPNSQPWNDFGLAVGLWLVGWYVLTPDRLPHLPTPRLWWGVLLLILGLGVFLRGYRIYSEPYGLWIDEVKAGVHARQMLNDSAYRPIYISIQNVSFPHLGIYAALIAVWDDYFISLRLWSGLLGVLTILLGFLVGRQLRGVVFGVWLAFLLAVMRWLFHYSRLAMTGIDAPFFVLLIIYLLIRYVRHPSARQAFYLAVGVGASSYFYQSMRLTIGLVILLGVLVVWRRAGWWRAARTSVLMGVVTLFLTMPLIVFARQHPEIYFERARQLSITSPDKRPPDTTVSEAFQQNLLSHLKMFHGEGDFNPRHNLAGAPMLDWLTGALFVLGLGVWAWLVWRRRGVVEEVFLLVPLPTALLTASATWSAEVPHAGRAILATLTVAYAASLAVWWLGGVLPKRAALVGGVLLALGILGLNVQTYLRQTNHYLAWAGFDGERRLAIEALVARAEAGNQLYFTHTPTYHYNVIEYFLDVYPVYEKQVAYITPTAEMPFMEFPTKPISVIVMPTHQWVTDYLHHIYPQAPYTAFRADVSRFTDAPAEPQPAIFYAIDLSLEDLQGVLGLSGLGAGYLYAPEFGVYRFRPLLPGALQIDGKTVQPGEPVYLSLGAHSIYTPAPMFWKPPNSAAYVSVPRYFLFRSFPSHGLRGYYYSNPDFAGLPRQVHVNPHVNQYIHNIPMARPYSVDWFGYLDVPQTGGYSFFLDVNAGYVEFYLDDVLVLQLEFGERFVETRAELEARPYAFHLRFKDVDPYTWLWLDWQPPGGQRESLPYDLLRPQ